jgi:hypothetical protein
VIFIHPPKIRFDPPDGDSSPIEASITSDGRIKLETDPDSCQLKSTWMTTAQLRDYILELSGLADAADLIYEEPS